jgi:succinoglycan biosynthesis protein ExoM
MNDMPNGFVVAPVTRAKAPLEHVAVVVCTSGRPRMLARCLASLATQDKPNELYMRIIVVSNGPDQEETHAVVENFKARAPFPLTYIKLAERNISRARNAGMFKADKLAADWVAFIDDDEIADPAWIANLMAPEWLQYDVVQGANIYEYPTPRPFWVVEKSLDTSDEGLARRTAAAGNVRFSLRLLRERGLVFDERWGLTGGEDNDFFSRAYRAGYSIRQTYKAITREPVHAERLTYFGQVYRAYWCAASDVRRLGIEKNSDLVARLRKAPTIPANMLAGLVLLLVVTPIATAFGGVPAFRKYALRAGKKWGKALGRLAATVGHKPKPYRVIHGR